MTENPEQLPFPEPDAETAPNLELEREELKISAARASLKKAVEITRRDHLDGMKNRFQADLSSKDPAKRCRAASFGLGSLTRSTEDAIIPMLVDGWKLLAQDASPDVRATLVTNLGFAHHCPSHFEDLLSDTDEKVQLSVIMRSLPFAFNPPERTVALYLSAPSADVRMAMIRRWSPGLGAVEEACATLFDPNNQVRNLAQSSPFSHWLRQPKLLQLYHRFITRHRT